MFIYDFLKNFAQIFGYLIDISEASYFLNKNNSAFLDFTLNDNGEGFDKNI